MNRMLSIFTLVCLLTTNIGCIKKQGLQDSYLLTDEMKSQNPFSGGESLYYITDSTEKYVFTGYERDNYTLEVPIGNDVSRYDLYEYDKMSFEAETGYYFSYDMHVNGGPKYYIDFHFENKGKAFMFILPLNIESTPHIDSIQIMGQWYHDIYIAEEEKVDNRAYKLYYSTDFGVLKIDFSDGSWWDLEKIEW